MDQLWSQSEGGDFYAMGECYHDQDHHQAMDLSEVDGALLMELMEDLPPSDLLLDNGDVDQLSHVIQSLEAEIGGGEAAMVDSKCGMAGVPNDHGGRLEDDMLGLDSYEVGSFGYCWPEVSLVEGWYVYDEELCEGSAAIGYEVMDHQHYDMQDPAQQVYSPLWG
ncbi:hypothetical protein ACP4OV_010017 [Aristida adscensionis]